MSFQFKQDTDQFVIIVNQARVDTNTAASFESEIFETLKDCSGSHVVIDASNMEYVSSAGLRVILKVLKQYSDLSMINVSSELFDILDMTGFTEMMKVEKGFKQFSVDGCKVLGAGAKGIVYRVGDDIIKVYKNPDSLPIIKRERELARKAFVLGIPTAISYDVVKVGNSYGSVFELLDCNSISKEIAENPSRIDDFAKIFADLLKTIHSTQVNPADMPDIKPRIMGWLDTCSEILTGKQAIRLKELIDAVPDRDTMLHCDYHTNNVMMQNGEAILIDMDTLSHGNPVFELCNIYIAYIGFGVISRSMVEDFMGLSYETCCEFWKLFINHYFEGKQAEELERIENKIELLGNLRLANHYLHRIDTNKDADAYIDYAHQEIDRLLPLVDSLSI